MTLQVPADMDVKDLKKGEDVKDLKKGDQVRATYLAVSAKPTHGPGPWFENKQN